MVPLLKVAAVGGICAGALYCTWWISSASGDIPFRDLSTDSDFDTNSGKTYHNKYAADYAKYFVGVHDKAKENLPDSNIKNDDWWNWSFENRYKKELGVDRKSIFQNINSASDLKNACKNAYKAETTKVKDNATENGDIEEKNIWAFCSIGGNKPTVIFKQGSNDNSSYEKTDKYAKLLISITDSNNDWFWKIKEVEFFGSETYSESSTDTSSEFKKLYDKKSEYKDYTHFQVKKLCGEAYKQNPTSSTTHPKNVVFKFCSLSGKEPQSETVTQTKGSEQTNQAKEQTEEAAKTAETAQK